MGECVLCMHHSVARCALLTCVLPSYYLLLPYSKCVFPAIGKLIVYSVRTRRSKSHTNSQILLLIIHTSRAFSNTLLLQNDFQIEWEPNYVPRQMHTPGIGLSDFVSDVGQIVQNRSRRRKERRISRRKKRGATSSDNAGLYHKPGFSTTDDRVDSSCDDDFENSDHESSIADGRNHGDDDVDIRIRKLRYNHDAPSANGTITNVVSPSDASSHRRTSQSDGTGYNSDKDATDDDLEML